MNLSSPVPLTAAVVHLRLRGFQGTRASGCNPSPWMFPSSYRLCLELFRNVFTSDTCLNIETVRIWASLVIYCFGGIFSEYIILKPLLVFLLKLETSQKLLNEIKIILHQLIYLKQILLVFIYIYLKVALGIFSLI